MTLVIDGDCRRASSNLVFRSGDKGVPEFKVIPGYLKPSVGPKVLPETTKQAKTKPKRSC